MTIMMNLSGDVDSEMNLEIEPGVFLYGGNTDTYLEWDQLDDSTVQKVEEILSKIPSGITRADGHGIYTDEWYSWDDAPLGLETTLEGVEKDLRDLIKKAVVTKAA